ncbi:MAG TPA: sulfatase [Actinomycetota bacterium]|nr:sulfatase [Actinomycetota bacterium]
MRFPFLAAAVSLLVPGCTEPVLPRMARAQLEPLNVLIIITDDQRNRGTLGVMPATRRIFARRGTRFPNAFATTPLCCPARASLFTGQYAHNHGVRNNGDARQLDQDRTLQAYLAQDGYRNALFGKFFYAFSVDTDPQHFDDWATTRAKRYSDILWNVHGQAETIQQYSTDYIRDRAVEFIADGETEDLRPWFMVLAPQAPHKPFTPAARHAGAPVPRWAGNPAVRERDRSDKPPYVRKWNVDRDALRSTRRKQLRSLMAVDDMTRVVFSTLRDLGEARHTLAFFLSDNGLMWGEHGLPSKRHSYTDSVEVPLFVRWPGEVLAGKRDRRLTGIIDVAPTILNAAGVTPDHPMDGRSLLSATTRDRILLEFWAEKSVPSWASIRTRGLQYAEYYRDDGTLSFREYYKLRPDPWQLVNLLHDGDLRTRPGTRALRRQLQADRRCAGAECP